MVNTRAKGRGLAEPSSDPKKGKKDKSSKDKSSSTQPDSKPDEERITPVESVVDISTLPAPNPITPVQENLVTQNESVKDPVESKQPNTAPTGDEEVIITEEPQSPDPDNSKDEIAGPGSSKSPSIPKTHVLETMTVKFIENVVTSKRFNTVVNERVQKLVKANPDIVPNVAGMQNEVKLRILSEVERKVDYITDKIEDRLPNLKKPHPSAALEKFTSFLNEIVILDVISPQSDMQTSINIPKLTENITQVAKKLENPNTEDYVQVTQGIYSDFGKIIKFKPKDSLPTVIPPSNTTQMVDTLVKLRKKIAKGTKKDQLETDVLGSIDSLIGKIIGFESASPIVKPSRYGEIKIPEMPKNLQTTTLYPAEPKLDIKNKDSVLSSGSKIGDSLSVNQFFSNGVSGSNDTAFDDVKSEARVPNFFEKLGTGINIHKISYAGKTTRFTYFLLENGGKIVDVYVLQEGFDADARFRRLEFIKGTQGTIDYPKTKDVIFDGYDATNVSKITLPQSSGESYSVIIEGALDSIYKLTTIVSRVDSGNFVVYFVDHSSRAIGTYEGKNRTYISKDITEKWNVSDHFVEIVAPVVIETKKVVEVRREGTVGGPKNKNIAPLTEKSQKRTIALFIYYTDNDGNEAYSYNPTFAVDEAVDVAELLDSEFIDIDGNSHTIDSTTFSLYSLPKTTTDVAILNNYDALDLLGQKDAVVDFANFDPDKLIPVDTSKPFTPDMNNLYIIQANGVVAKVVQKNVVPKGLGSLEIRERAVVNTGRNALGVQEGVRENDEK